MNIENLKKDVMDGRQITGANAAISGDMLTTAGITVETDMKLLKKLGYEVRFDCRSASNMLYYY